MKQKSRITKKKIFISWSGNKSRKVATELCSFIKSIIPGVDPFLSTGDIQKGSVWFDVISKNLSNASFGIFCVTKENMHAPWLLFEAGAIFKGIINKARICTLLVDLEPKDLGNPLGLFNGTEFIKEQLLLLIETINKIFNKHSRLNEIKINEKLNKLYSKIQKLNMADTFEDKINFRSAPKNIVHKIKERENFLQKKIYNNTVSAINSGRIPTLDGAHGYFNFLLEILESTEKGDLEEVCVFACFTKEDFVKSTGSPWPKNLLNKYKQLAIDKNIKLEYVMFFENKKHRDEYKSLIKDYRSYVDKISFLFYKDGEQQPLEKRPEKSIVLLKKQKWAFTHSWNGLFGHMENSTLYLEINDFNSLQKEYNHLKMLSKAEDEYVKLNKKKR